MTRPAEFEIDHNKNFKTESTGGEMKSLFNKTVVFLVGLLSVVGISVNTSDVFAAIAQDPFAKYDSYTETTPLFLYHGTTLIGDEDSATLAGHYSHSSHSSHYSHSSHSSHYSSRY